MLPELFSIHDSNVSFDHAITGCNKTNSFPSKEAHVLVPFNLIMGTVEGTQSDLAHNLNIKSALKLP